MSSEQKLLPVGRVGATTNAAAKGRPEQGSAPSGGSAVHEVTSVGVHIVIMGVAGCGKSAVGERLAKLLGLPLIEGDDFHPAANVQKMQQGIALDDADRDGWLQTLAAELVGCPQGAVLACSALKASYRNALRARLPALSFVYLAITPAEALKRVAARANHFYPPSLVASQFEALQDPSEESRVLALDGSVPLDALARRAADWVRGGGLNADRAL